MMENIAGAKQHLRDHQSYPATAEDLKTACNDLSDFSDADKKLFVDSLPDGTYQSADEVIKALGW